MVNRNFDISNISSSINNIATTSDTLLQPKGLNDFTGTVFEDYKATNVTSNDSVINFDPCDNTGIVNTTLPKRDLFISFDGRGLDKTISDILSTDCDKAIDFNNIIGGMSVFDTNIDFDTTVLSEALVTSEMTAAGMADKIDSTMIGNAASSIKKSLEEPGLVDVKNTINKYMDATGTRIKDDSCTISFLSILDISNLGIIFKGSILDTLLNSWNDDCSMVYLDYLFGKDPEQAINALEFTMSKNNNTDNIVDKLKMLSVTYNNSPDSPKRLNKGIVIDNVNNTPDEQRNSHTIMKSIDAIYDESEIYIFKDKEVISGMADDVLNYRKSNDTLDSTTKETNLDLVTMIKLTNDTSVS